MQIIIDKFPINMHIGHLAYEREAQQKVFFSLVLNLKPLTTVDPIVDELAATVDYGDVMALLDEKFVGKEFLLLETVCHRAGQLILEYFPKVMSLRVEIEKSVLPQAITRTARVRIAEEFTREQISL